jgi:hypothetical protein
MAENRLARELESRESAQRNKNLDPTSDATGPKSAAGLGLSIYPD